ncbi:hypothetical protein D3C75_1335020 [compost metagenome]
MQLKEVFFLLMPLGDKLWELHEGERERPAEHYRQLLKAYHPEELGVIQRFLSDLISGM